MPAEPQLRQSPDLPPELTSLIFSHLRSKSDLVRVSRCSKRFQDEAQSHLYSNLELRPLPVSTNHPDDRFRLRALTELFINSPQKAVLVRTLSIRPAFIDGFEEYDENSPVRFPASEKVRQLIHGTAASHLTRTAWYECYSRDNEDAMLAVLLCTLPKLATIDFAISGSAPFVFRTLSVTKPYHTFLSMSQTELARLLPAQEHTTAGQRLHCELRDICWSGKRDHETPFVWTEALFNLPSAKRLYLQFFDSIERAWDDTVWTNPYMYPNELRELPDGTSSITSIELRQCSFAPSDIITILQTPRALRSFIWEIGSSSERIHTVNEMRNLRKALDRHNSSLETLSLDYTEEEPMDETMPPAALGGLQDFTKLSKLQLANIFWLGGDSSDDVFRESCLFDILPRNITTLKLTKCDETLKETCSAVQYILEHRSSLPQLSSISLRIEEGTVRDCGREAEICSLLRLAETSGIWVIVWEQCGMSDRERGWGFSGEVEWAEQIYDELPDFNKAPSYKAVTLESLEEQVKS
ncbi:uncharacterized protein LTR77_008935 [Saxophila tyrrhenica]|uniref:F-box domain-containing protein n=1 Tax=Saxophila tyrrhenica TaxID=1690608 RepID=A0AAV9P1Z0_9PEZI|nr:hypothetical protein LTR77_008935 [Saxophila tyrrhenica]